MQAHLLSGGHAGATTAVLLGRGFVFSVFCQKVAVIRFGQFASACPSIRIRVLWNTEGEEIRVESVVVVAGAAPGGGGGLGLVWVLVLVGRLLLKP